MTALLITLTAAVRSPAAAPGPARPQSQPAEGGQMDCAVQHRHADRGSYPGADRGRSRDARQMPEVGREPMRIGGLLLRTRAGSGRSQPFQAAQPPGADVGMAQHRVQVARLVAVERSQEGPGTQQSGLSILRDIGRSRPGLVHGAEQPADQGVLGLGELSHVGRVTEAPGEGPEARGAQRVRGDIQAVRWPGRQPAADMRDQLKQVRAIDRRVSEAIAAPVAVGVETSAAASDDRAFPAGLAQPAAPC